MKKAFRICCIIFFIAGITAKDFAALGWNIWYVTNIEYVAQELCQNKARPELKCNGKCYLAKQLKKAEEPVPSSTPERSLKLKSVDWIAVEPVSEISIPAFNTACTKCAWPEQQQSLHAFSPSVFHPPAV